MFNLLKDLYMSSDVPTMSVKAWRYFKSIGENLLTNIFEFLAVPRSIRKNNLYKCTKLIKEFLDYLKR